MSEMHQYTVKPHRGKPTVHDNGQPRSVVLYSPGCAFGNTAREDVDRFCGAGVTDFFLWVGRHETEVDTFTTPFWHSVNIFDHPHYVSPERFVSLPERIDYITARCPDARFFIRFYSQPPISWKKAHPEELVVSEDGTQLNEVSLASEKFAVEQKRFFLHLMGWLESQPWSWRIMGYLTLHDYEGTTLNALLGGLYDFSEPMRKAFRALGLDAKEVPQNRFLAEASEGRGSHWPEPGTTETERAYFDLVRSLFLARCRSFFQAAQQALNSREVLLGMDALKQGMQGWHCESYFRGQPPRAHHSNVLLASGSTGAAEFLDLPGFNVLQTPYDYTFRQMGGCPEPEGIADSITLREKLFLAEDDCRTYLCSENEAHGYYRTPREVEVGMWRNAAAAIARGYHGYWMDVTSFPSPRGGYFRDDAIMKVIESIVPVFHAATDWERVEQPGIAVIVDDTSGSWENFSADFQSLAVMWQRLTGLSQCGVPFRTYLFEDLLEENFPDHKLFLFPNLFCLNKERHQILKDKVCHSGRVVIWGPGTGITDGKTLGSDWASEVTRMSLDLLPDESYSRRVVLTGFDHPITENLHGSMSYGDSAPYGPALLPRWEDGISVQGTVLAQRGVNRPGLAIKEIGAGEGAWTSIFSAAAPLPADLIREAARYAGAHVYSEENDVILASKYFLAVHSTRRGCRTIALPQVSRVTDPVTGSVISERTESLEIEVDPPQTRLFRLEPV